MLLGGHPAHAGRRALADVTEQAGPAGALRALVDGIRAGTHGEGLEQDVDGLPHRPDLRVRAEVPRALHAARARHHDPRHPLAEGDGDVGVRLVVSELHVEGRVELFDPGVFELQRLELAADDGPLDSARRRDHATSALVQAREWLEVVAQPRAQVLGLAHVENSTALVVEAVDPRLDGNLSACGAPVLARGHVRRR